MTGLWPLSKWQLELHKIIPAIWFQLNSQFKWRAKKLLYKIIPLTNDAFATLHYIIVMRTLKRSTS